MAVLLAGTLATIGMANAAHGCGPGCHSARHGGCVVDGWGTGAPAWNECPAGARRRFARGERMLPNWRPTAA